MMMNIKQAIDYVYASYMKAEPHLAYLAKDSEKRNPKFSKKVIEAYQKKQAEIPTVLITGSKGKGSVAKMIAELLGVHGTTGLMTSPHILHFTERIQIQGKPVSDAAFAKAISEIKPQFDAIQDNLRQQEYISPMGIQAAAALHLFGEAKVSYQVMECGKGVAQDDVNNVAHDYAVINRIFLEHTRELGDTLEKIAQNKSAIIQKGQKAVFVSEQEPEVMQVLQHKAEEENVPLYVYGKDFWAEQITYTKEGMCFDVVTGNRRYKDIKIPLLGTYQAKNAALALALAEKLLSDTKKGSVIDEIACKEVLKKLKWPGRLEILSTEPFCLLDACIHRTSCSNVLEAFQKLHIDRAIVIIGIPSDKDYLGVAQAMKPAAQQMILTKSQNVHYKFDKDQVMTLQQHGIEATWADHIEEALQMARQFQQTNPNTPICILGTTSLISEVEATIRKQKEEKNETNNGI